MNSKFLLVWVLAIQMFQFSLAAGDKFPDGQAVEEKAKESGKKIDDRVLQPIESRILPRQLSRMQIPKYNSDTNDERIYKSYSPHNGRVEYEYPPVGSEMRRLYRPQFRPQQIRNQYARERFAPRNPLYFEVEPMYYENSAGDKYGKPEDRKGKEQKDELKQQPCIHDMALFQNLHQGHRVLNEDYDKRQIYGNLYDVAPDDRDDEAGGGLDQENGSRFDFAQLRKNKRYRPANYEVDHGKDLEAQNYWK